MTNEQQHCPGCFTTDGDRPNVVIDSVLQPCPGVFCPACAEKDEVLAHVQREMEAWATEAGVNERRCQEKDAEIEKVSIAHKVVSRLLSKRMKEIGRLTALLAVGREMAEVIKCHRTNHLWGTDTMAGGSRCLCAACITMEKWRSLEGKNE